MNSSRSDISDGVIARYAQEFPTAARLEIVDWQRISDGWETDVYAFGVEHGTAADERTRDDLILRIYPGHDAAPTAVNEFNVMKRVLAAGFPVPRMILLELDPAYVGGPFVIMERIDGRPLGDIADEASAEERLEFLTRFIHIMIDLHQLDWRPHVVDGSIAAKGDPGLIVRDELSQWRRTARSLNLHAFDPALDWLETRIETIRFGPPSLIHLDFHPYNVLMHQDGSAYVIDWTNAQVSDYRLDLAWTLLLASSYGQPEAREFLLGEYERKAGHIVEQLAFFEVAASVRRLASIMISLSVGAETLGMRAGAEESMANLPHITKVYAIFRDRSGLRLPEIEAFLSTLR